jgi:hypothetical protein
MVELILRRFPCEGRRRILNTVPVLDVKGRRIPLAAEHAQCAVDRDSRLPASEWYSAAARAGADLIPV